MRLDKLAEALQLDYLGDADFEVTGLCSIDNPCAQHLGFALSARLLKRFIDQDQPVAVLVRREWIDRLSQDERTNSAPQAYLYSPSPYDSFVDAMALYYPEARTEPGVHPSAQMGENLSAGANLFVGANAVIGRGVRLGDNVSIGPGCVIEDDVSIGDHSRLDARVVVYHGCVLGQRCRLYAGSVIGADGFGHLPRPDGGWRKIPHLGNVRIGDDVRIGAGTTIDRAVMDATVVESGVKLDNLIHIGHNAFIGTDTAMAAGALVSGHAHIGKRCRVGGGASFAAVDIADDTTILGETSISKNISEPGTTVLGYMGFMPVRRWRRWLAFLHRLENQNSRNSAQNK